MSNGPRMPPIGLGTYRISDDEGVETIRTALDIGYRHIDTAEAYGNEEAVGTGIETADVPRSEVFLATKVLHPRHASGYSQSAIRSSVEDCLDRLGVDSVDLLYGVHWPRGGGYDPEATFAACAEIVEKGQAEHIGVCNMTPRLIDEAVAHSSVPIDVLQVELHPLLPQPQLRDYCATNDITIVAYASLGNRTVLDEPILQEIAKRHDVTTAQVSLAWLREKGAVPIPKASSEAHLRENLNSVEIDLERADIEAIDAIDRRHREYDPSYGPDW